MKKLIIAVTLLLSSAAWSDDVNLLMGWNPAIPAKADRVLELIDAEAKYFSFETDSEQCGGSVIKPELLAYSSEETDDGNEVHLVTVGFQMTMPVNYCAEEREVSCVAEVEVYSENGIVLKSWECEKPL